MTTRGLPTVLPLLASACLLAACGGGDDAASADDGDDIATLGTSDTVTHATPTEPGGTGGGSAPDDSASDGSDLTTQATASEDPEEAMEQFTDCMHDHGVDLPDPQAPGAGGQNVAVTIDPGDADNMQEAQEACGHLMENVRNDIELDPEEQAERQAEMLEFTECMRDHGIEMDDPVFADEGGLVIDMSSDGASEEQAGGPPIRDQEEFDAAAAECGGPGGGSIFSSSSEDD